MKNFRKLRGTSRYQKLRRRVLVSEPLCRPCKKKGYTVGANEVDHIIPVHKDPGGFWKRENIQPICASCHEKKTAEENQDEGTPEQRAWREYLDSQC